MNNRLKHRRVYHHQRFSSCVPLAPINVKMPFRTKFMVLIASVLAVNGLVGLVILRALKRWGGD